MSITAAPSEPEPTKRGRVTLVPDQVLARARKDLNQATARRIYENESQALVPRLEAAIAAKREAEQLLALGEWGGIPTSSDALRQALKNLNGPR